MKRTIPVVGMACSACSANVERKLRSLEGVTDASVSLPGRSATVDYDPSVISLEQMKQHINDLGYDLVIESDRSVEQIQRRAYVLLRRRTVLSWVFAVLVMSISMGWLPLGNATTAHQISLLLALANLWWCGRSFYVSAFKQLRHGNANMDTLVMLSTAISLLFSGFNTFWGDAVWSSRGMVWHTYYDAAVMIITFVLTGRLLEERAKDSMASSIRQLMGLAPKMAHVVRMENGQEVLREVPIATIVPGDLLEVAPGEKVPVDGEVTQAESFMTPDAAYVDESMITGEPTPAEKRKGSKVLAGTIPSQGKFRFKACQVGEDTALAHIVRMVQQAQGSKAPIQRTVDRVAQIFVPVVAALSLLTFLIWWLVGGSAVLPQAVLSSVAVLVVACPCAMGLATPTALMVGVGKAAKQQVLIKDAMALERLRQITAVVMDKTGTLTIPNQQVDFTKADSLPLEERETLKPHAREAMDQLHHLGIEVYLMSGDKEEVVAYWAAKAGIEHYHSKALPQDKENLVRQLQQQGYRVAMIGDGINDTQALALADVAMAMGRGTDVAMDVAQVTLMGDDMLNIPRAVKLSRRTTRMIGQNLFWAFVYNVVCIPLAAGVPYLFGIDFQITPTWASALMACSSVSVVANSLRLR